MRYFVSLDPTPGREPTAVDVVQLPTGQLEVTIGGRAVAVDTVAVDGALSVRIDGQVVDLTVEGTPPDLGAIASGHRSYVRVESERFRTASLAKRGGGGGSDKIVKAPMPGRVIRVVATEGVEVAAGGTLCVIEAMKMENEVKAKATVTVAKVHVTEGATIEAGGTLFTLK